MVISSKALEYFSLNVTISNLKFQILAKFAEKGHIPFHSKTIPFVKAPKMTLLRKSLLDPSLFPNILFLDKSAFKLTNNILNILLKFFFTQNYPKL